ncbi:hypothetical protein KSP40_PGU016128 [Platanthera guangdongensis]|uniref:Uncharacterized protein n=1 Tax=Platanthera guangdongensis TaxID=2320717 RepID=A0ABR2LIX0_9ASPA
MHMEDLHQLSSFSSSSQESGWSTYLDDYCGHSSFLPGGSSSTVSDAASAAWNPIPAAGEPRRSCQKSKSKKKKGRDQFLVDNSLEDTASSAVNDNRPKGKIAGYVDCEEQGREGINELDNVGRVKDECSGLRARGLCLVPLSMLSNYLG